MHALFLQKQFAFPLQAPEVNLCVASSIPLCNATGNAFRNSFFYEVCQLHIWPAYVIFFISIKLQA